MSALLSARRRRLESPRSPTGTPPLVWTTPPGLQGRTGARGEVTRERGAEATLRHLALVLEIDGDPLRGVHPETAALYARLSGRTPQVSPIG